MDLRSLILIASRGILLAALILLIGSLCSCAADYGMHIEKTTVVEQVIEEYETVGELGFEYGIAYDQAVDILFVVDESGSMSDNQEELAQNMPAVFSVLTGPTFTNLKWRAGITSTDPTSPIYAWIDHDDPDAYIKLLTLTSFLDNHPYEAGLESVVKQIAWDNTGFFRTDADALFIYISDEEDQSSIDISTYEQILASWKQYPFIPMESSIVYTELLESGAMCGTWNAENLGLRYEQVSEVTVDLCDYSNWIDVLNPAKDHIPTLNEKWILDDGVPVWPAEDNIEVFFDDEVTPDWFYNSTDNSVNLLTIPEPGTQVSIVYLVEPV